MAEHLTVTPNASKADIYAEILPQIQSVIEGEHNLTANLANICAILNEAFEHLWTGFYLRDDNGDSLVLGPFQGPLACTRIPLKPVARGVCGKAAAQRETILVSNVHTFPGHIACSAQSNSEIVVPLIKNGRTELVLDIDSASLNNFDDADVHGLEQLIQIIKDKHYT